MNQNYYLIPTEQRTEKDYRKKYSQTEITNLVMDHAQNIYETVPDKNDLKSYALSVAHYIRDELLIIENTSWYPTKSDSQFEINKEIKKRLFRNRTSHEILEEGVFPSCSDPAQLSVTFMRALGFPAKYLESVHEDYLLNQPRNIKHWIHALSQFYSENDSLILDWGMKPDIYNDEKDLYKGAKFLIAMEGWNSWDLGVNDYSSWKRIKDDHEVELKSKLRELSPSYANSFEVDAYLKEFDEKYPDLKVEF